MGKEFNFNQYNTDLDKKLRRVRNGIEHKTLVRVAITVILIVIVAILIIIKVKNTVSEPINEIKNNVSNLSKEQIKENIGNTAEDIQKNIRYCTKCKFCAI